MNRNALSALFCLSALFAAAPPASAGVVYTSQAAFNAALTSSFMTDNWSGDHGYIGSGYYYRMESTGGYYPTEYGVNASGVQSAGNAYSTNEANSQVRFMNFDGGANAFGGYLFSMDLGSNVIAGSIILNILGADPLSNYTITTPGNGGPVPFFGYIGSGSISSVNFNTQVSGWSAADRIVVGNGVNAVTATLPEPASLGLVAAAFGALVFVRRQKPAR